MKKFNEVAMVAGLLNREVDALAMKKKFQPEWLQNAELVPILRGIYGSIDRDKTPPSLATLHEIMEEEDSGKYNARWKATLLQIGTVNDEKLQIKAIGDAKEFATVKSLGYLLAENRFQQMLADGKAKDLKKAISEWLIQQSDTDEEQLMTVQESFDRLLDEYPWQGRSQRIKTGIRPIDEWSGGLRPKQLGFIIAPTGHGKSAVLMNIARHGAVIEGKVVLFITNELSWEEQSERFLVRFQEPLKDEAGNFTNDFVTLDNIQEDPTLAYRQATGYQRTLLDNLHLFTARLGHTAADIESTCHHFRSLHGKFPEVVIVDYMERMGTVTPTQREQSWTYYGQIAKELVSLSRKLNVALWTAAQTNRGALKSDVEVGLEHLQGSIQHAQEATYVVTVRKKMVQQANGVETACLEFKEQKARHSKMEGRKMDVKVDLSRMLITDEEVESIKEIEESTDEAAPDIDPAKVGKLNTGDSTKVRGKAYKGKK